MNWLFKWMKLIDTVFMRYRKMLAPIFCEKPYLLDQGFYKIYRVREINHQRLVYDISISWLQVIVGFILSYLGFFLIYFVFSFMTYNILQITDSEIFRIIDVRYKDDPFIFIFFITSLCSLFIFLFFPVSLLGFLYPFFKPKDRLVIFDRENQTVTIPQRYWGGESEVIPFNELKVKSVSDYGSGTYMSFYLNAMRPGDGQPAKIGFGNSKKDMSLFVQYMKKGEMSLPEGELLDPYRHLDPFTKMQDEL